jgi:hypothetical protein
MLVGIISDSHDDRKYLQKAVELFIKHKVSYIFHSGDIVSPFAAKIFHQVKSAKLIAVYGNNDGEKLFLKGTVESGQGEIHEYCYKGTIAGKRIFMTHTHHCIEEIIASQTYDLVIYGHTHKQDIRREGKTLVINPGESTDWLTGTPHIVLLNLTDMQYEIIPL